MKTIDIANQKSGVGKTTFTINIGAGLTQLGKKVLLINMRIQPYLKCSFGRGAVFWKDHLRV